MNPKNNAYWGSVDNHSDQLNLRFASARRGYGSANNQEGPTRTTKTSRALGWH